MAKTGGGPYHETLLHTDAADMPLGQARSVVETFEKSGRTITDEMMETIVKGGYDWRKYAAAVEGAQMAMCMDAMARLLELNELGYAIHECWMLPEDLSLFRGTPYQRLKNLSPPFKFEKVKPVFSQAEAVLVDMTGLLRKHMESPCIIRFNDQTIKGYVAIPEYQTIAGLIEEFAGSYHLPPRGLECWEIEHDQVYSALGAPNDGKRRLNLNAGVPACAYSGFSKDLKEFVRKWHAELE